MAVAPPTAPSSSSPAAGADATTAGAAAKAWVVTTTLPTSGPREAVLLRRLKALDPEIEAVEVQEFYLVRTRGADDALAKGITGVLREAAAGGEAAGSASEPAMQQQHHYHHWRAYAPRAAFRSVWSSNVRSILTARGLLVDEGDPRLLTLEAGRWYRVTKGSAAPLGEAVEALLHDRMTECAFPPLLLQQQYQQQQWGAVGATVLPAPLPAGVLLDRDPVKGTLTLPLRARGPVVLEEVSAKYGLGLGPWEVEFLTDLFRGPHNGIERDPTEVEIFDVAQSLSEHCRHWTFDGRFVVDGEERAASLMEMVKAPLRRLRDEDEDDNSLLAFEDNSSAIRGPARVLDFQPLRPDGPSPYVRVEVRLLGGVFGFDPSHPTCH